jgi:hypothetical protein
MNTLLLVLALVVACQQQQPPEPVRHPDPIVATLLDHLEVRPIIVVVDRQTVGDDTWKRVKSLNAFRVHRHVDGRVVTDAAIYLVKGSDLYREAALAGSKSDVWCKLAAVIMHELQHTAPLTEKAALEAEMTQVKECLKHGHFQEHGNTYLMELARKSRTVKEHYTY